MEALKQKQYSPYPLWKQVVELFAVKNRYLDSLPVDEVSPFLKDMDEFLLSRKRNLIDDIMDKKQITPETEKALLSSIEEFIALRK